MTIDQQIREMDRKIDFLSNQVSQLIELQQKAAGQGGDHAPERISLSHKEEFQAMLAHRARLDEADKKRKLRQSG